MENKDRALSHPKPLEDDPKSQRADQDQVARTVQQAPAQGFRVSINSPICRECLGGIAHRLAQPMTALRGSIELGLMGKRTVEDYHSILEQMLHLADNMVKVIVSLRDLGDSVVPVGPSESVNLKSTLDETLVEMKSLAQMKGLHFAFKAGQHMDANVNPWCLREALRSLMMWILQNTAGDGTIDVKLSLAGETVQVLISPPRMDLQYLQIKLLDDITTPDVSISHAAQTGHLDWSNHQRAIDALGGKLDIQIEGYGPAAICISLPAASAAE